MHAYECFIAHLLFRLLLRISYSRQKFNIYYLLAKWRCMRPLITTVPRLSAIHQIDRNFDYSKVSLRIVNVTVTKHVYFLCSRCCGSKCYTKKPLDPYIFCVERKGRQPHISDMTGNSSFL